MGVHAASRIGNAKLSGITPTTMPGDAVGADGSADDVWRASVAASPTAVHARAWLACITLQPLWYYYPVKTISLKLPNPIDARLESRARELGKTKSEITREALARFLEEPATSGTLSCLDLVRDLVGTARGPGDLASNKKHMRGYGR